MRKQTRQSIIEKAMMFLDRAEDKSSPDEAAIAARMARKYIDKHQINESELKKKCDFKTIEVLSEGVPPPQWKQFIFAAVCKYNDCICTMEIRHFETTAMIINGYEIDAIVCCKFVEYLFSAVQRLCSGYGFEEERAEVYMNSVAQTIAHRFYDMDYERRYGSSGNCKDLVLNKYASVEERFGPQLKREAEPVSIDDPALATAMGLGKIDGKTLSLNDQLENDVSRETLEEEAWGETNC